MILIMRWYPKLKIQVASLKVKVILKGGFKVRNCTGAGDLAFLLTILFISAWYGQLCVDVP
jgi:hypothetical protein